MKTFVPRSQILIIRDDPNLILHPQISSPEGGGAILYTRSVTSQLVKKWLLPILGQVRSVQLNIETSTRSGQVSSHAKNGQF